MKVGFKRGCRPLIRVDGCHLKGAFPGMILVVVSKDGNNNIFPVAWGVVEVENSDSWIWFLGQLMKDVAHLNGEGLTLMSDRQKGLLEAIDEVAPKAEVRFCVRHIWANFKLKFSGTTYKEHFWKAARASTKDAHKYLNAIPPQHWSRHAFNTTSKSNMLLNNICETFNAVLKDARDKPIITCLEWNRRYVMKRNTEKWEGIQSYEGIPCPHAFACIVKRRLRPERYLQAYSPYIRPMPGVKHWEKSSLVQPGAPIISKMPGRPKLKKRKKEAGEVEEEMFVKRGKRQNKCSNCGQPGHNKVKCKKPPVVKEPEPVQKGGRPASNDPYVVAQRKKKAARVNQMTYDIGAYNFYAPFAPPPCSQNSSHHPSTSANVPTNNNPKSKLQTIVRL
ncbi:uncharacterized protein [Spinacia oleracea]|uniref:CCHC-type domain-containing protein n=1 Tax=Spinacia oleracea TaxID=3562 RepID=A0ABM3R7N2_SPIOL|nr:uncharacterized protein LOC130467215 [Spinacia oleracea]